MTFQEYCNQKDTPERRPKVLLTRRDIYASWSGVPNGEYVQLAIPNHYNGGEIEYYTYFVKDGETHFRTIDEDGNPKNLSVFRWASLACGRLLPYLKDQLN